MTTVRVEDIRALRYCMAGTRKFFTRHGLDFHHFIENGIPAAQLPQDDAMAAAAIEQARQREQENTRGKA